MYTDLWDSHVSFALDMKKPLLIHTSLYFPEARIYTSFKVPTKKLTRTINNCISNNSYFMSLFS